MYNCPAVSRKHYFLVVSYCLCFLQYFLLIFHNDLWALGGADINILFRDGFYNILFSASWLTSCVVSHSFKKILWWELRVAFKIQVQTLRMCEHNCSRFSHGVDDLSSHKFLAPSNRARYGLHLFMWDLSQIRMWLVIPMIPMPLLHQQVCPCQTNHYCNPQGSQLDTTDDYLSPSVVSIALSSYVKACW